MLNAEQAREQAKRLHDSHVAERGALDLIRRYWKGRQKLPAVIPTGEPAEVKVMARSSRVNVMPIVVNSLVQSTYVDGYRQGKDENNLEVWKAWQANRMDARQTAIHRATAAYGTAYAVVLPGEPVPVIRGASPRGLHAMYGEDPDWPMWALERLGHGLWRLYDEDGIYYLSDSATYPGSPKEWQFISSEEHGLGVTPVVRFLNEHDLDDEDEVEPDAMGLPNLPWPLTRGEIGPLAPIQDQIDLTTFDLQIAQHYAAFKQRYIIGWAAESEAEAIKVSAQRLVTIDNAEDDTFDPSSVKVGEWQQSDLDGYLKSRDSSLNHVASLAQLPLHELSGDAKLVNLSAEALAAAEASKDRKVGERQTVWGESHEQIFWAVGQYMGTDVPDDAEVRWRETSARSFAATVDGLGKLAMMLGIPPQELWERVPGATKQDVDRWKSAAESGDAFANLATMLDRQSNGSTPAPAFG